MGVVGGVAVTKWTGIVEVCLKLCKYRDILVHLTTTIKLHFLYMLD